jgi:hypothetical protein
MAYLIDTSKFCDEDGCNRVATHTVYSSNDFVCGYYCGKHAELKVKELSKYEAEHERNL